MTGGREGTRAGAVVTSGNKASSSVGSGKGPPEHVCGGSSGWCKACCCGRSEAARSCSRLSGRQEQSLMQERVAARAAPMLEQPERCRGSNGSGGESSRELLPTCDSDNSTAREPLELARELDRAEPSWLFCSCR
ncbi:unnamed protein product [Urochloa humidicola]